MVYGRGTHRQSDVGVYEVGMNYRNVFTALDLGYKQLYPDMDARDRRREIGKDTESVTIMNMMEHYLSNEQLKQVYETCPRQDMDTATLFEGYLKALISKYKEEITIDE